jgi:hypothetical protein
VGLGIDRLPRSGPLKYSGDALELVSAEPLAAVLGEGDFIRAKAGALGQFVLLETAPDASDPEIEAVHEEPP